MNPTTQSRIQMFGAWCAIAYLVVLFIAWGPFAGFLPPTPPSATATEVGQLFQAGFTGIRIGMVGIMIAALVFIPFAAVTSQLLARVEGGPGVLTYSFLLGAAGNMCLTFYPAIWWLVAAFRPERAPELIYLMNDLAWLQFLGGVTLYLAMPFAMAVAAFCDTSANPIFPRWSGFVNIWLVVILIPDQLLFFFQKGAFAWNGLFGLYLPIVGFGGFFIVTFIVLRKAILRDRVAGGR